LQFVFVICLIHGLRCILLLKPLNARKLVVAATNVYQYTVGVTAIQAF